MRLTPKQLADWARDGWLVAAGAVDGSAVRHLETWVEELQRWAASGGPGLHHFEQTPHGPAIARSEKFADDHEGLAAFLTGRLLGDVLAQLFGEPAVLFKEKVNYKHPGGAGFAPHQDATAYRFVDHHISVLVPLDPMTEASGCLFFAAGQHHTHLPVDDRGRIAERLVRGMAWRPVEVAPGDLVFFDSYTPHHSGTNRTDRSRRALYLTYNAASLGDFRAEYYRDKEDEFAREGATFADERVRMSISDDFLGHPVDPASLGRPDDGT